MKGKFSKLRQERYSKESKELIGLLRADLENERKLRIKYEKEAGDKQGLILRLQTLEKQVKDNTSDALLLEQDEHQKTKEQYEREKKQIAKLFVRLWRQEGRLVVEDISLARKLMGEDALAGVMELGHSRNTKNNIKNSRTVLRRIRGSIASEKAASR